ncbi:hypothetical protein FHT02_000378 [Sphingomonas xinjiangensis]|uniref:Uncharacterized protein n=1 Tax=Sphingomonas xinjiangensis TaxID=643568 RepID=A0A840YNP5_9SPHN|nr:hypothetical protein [Sphingomonas xinjiangensis]
MPISLAGMRRVAANIAQEVGMLLDRQRPHPGAGEQQPGNHARRAAPTM